MAAELTLEVASDDVEYVLEVLERVGLQASADHDAAGWRHVTITADMDEAALAAHVADTLSAQGVRFRPV